LRFHGKYFSLDLMTSFFDPGPILWPHIPIGVAGVNTGLCKLAGEVAELFLVHPLHTVRYLREIVLPALRAGESKADKARDTDLSVTAFVVTGRDEGELAKAAREVKKQLAFYASTPSYRAVLELHDRAEVASTLRRMAAEGRWDAMAEVVDDEFLGEVAVVAEPDYLAEALVERYRGLATRVTPYVPFDGVQSPIPWEQLVQAACSVDR
jgi:probable F420-dependent oxidoreductase